MFTKLFPGLFLSLGLVFAGAPAADKAAPQDCCQQKLACCAKDKACCVATTRLGCCAKGMDCCAKNKACCAAVQKCCQEGAKCCDAAKACCGPTVTKPAASKGDAKDCCAR
jgi:hypothetical protein